MSDFLWAVPGAFTSDFSLAPWGALAGISFALTALYWASRIRRLGEAGGRRQGGKLRRVLSLCFKEEMKPQGVVGHQHPLTH